MNKPQWTHEHGVLLESLRKRAGMDRATLARRNMLSVLQVAQLETGGDSGFYNAEIKFSSGKKLLQFFGHTLQVEIEVAAEVASSISNTASPPLEVAPQQAAAAKPAFKISGLGGALMVMAVLMAVFFLVQQSSNSVSKPSTEAAIQGTQPEPKQEAVLVTPSPAPAPAPAPLADGDKQPLPALPETDKKEAPSKPQVLNAACAWEPTDTEIQPTSARKKGEYVHVVASDNVSLCVMDGNQRVASLSLTPGQERSIYGPGPFKVYSQQLPLVKIYFQGQAIKLPSPEIRQITLKPAALP
jgi:transcriptional regulator with XRE-family HTH domain